MSNTFVLLILKSYLWCVISAAYLGLTHLESTNSKAQSSTKQLMFLQGIMKYHRKIKIKIKPPNTIQQ